jgi:hypothetical protein
MAAAAISHHLAVAKSAMTEATMVETAMAKATMTEATMTEATMVEATMVETVVVEVMVEVVVEAVVKSTVVVPKEQEAAIWVRVGVGIGAARIVVAVAPIVGLRGFCRVWRERDGHGAENRQGLQQSSWVFHGIVLKKSRRGAPQLAPGFSTSG